MFFKKSDACVAAPPVNEVVRPAHARAAAEARRERRGAPDGGGAVADGASDRWPAPHAPSARGPRT